jgi:hypothetical protein
VTCFSSPEEVDDDGGGGGGGAEIEQSIYALVATE